MQSHKVTSPDGLTIAAVECGNPAGPEILFIHGYSQCHLSWMRQLTDPAMTAAFHMVALDLRGHGASDKPAGVENYSDDRLWADDVAAVMAATGLRRPVLVGWSYAGRTVTDYVRHHGLGSVAGINFVAAAVKDDPAFFGRAYAYSLDMMSEDLATSIAATRAFLRACFELQPAPDDFETMLAFNMMVPPAVRTAIRRRTPNLGDLLPTLSVPVLVSHGDRDQPSLLARSQHTAAQVPSARLSVYEGIGHSPFWEDAPRFNRELAEFVRAANS